MSNILKSSAMLLAGLGASVAVGWWLKQREQMTAHHHPSGQGLGNLDLHLDNTSHPEEIISITLPPEAFEDIDQDNIVITSEIVVDHDDPWDDLTQISGIGGKTLKTLNEMGIKTFADLAGADPAAIKQQITRASLETIQTWIKAAQELKS